MRRLAAVVGVARGVLDLGIELVLGLVVYAWGALLALALAGVILLTCAGCAVEGEGVSFGSCATCGGKGVSETKAKDVVLCAVLAGCASEGVSVDAGVDAEGPTRGPGVADSAGLADDVGAVSDVVAGVDAGADVARVVDVGADLAGVADAGGQGVDAWDLPRRCTEGERKLGSNAKVCGMVRGRWCQEFFSEVWASLAPCIYSDRPGYIFVLAGRCADCALYGEVTP
jgi:hypothetical protein